MCCVKVCVRYRHLCGQCSVLCSVCVCVVSRNRHMCRKCATFNQSIRVKWSVCRCACLCRCVYIFTNDEFWLVTFWIEFWLVPCWSLLLDWLAVWSSSHDYENKTNKNHHYYDKGDNCYCANNWIEEQWRYSTLLRWHIFWWRNQILQILDCDWSNG